MQKLGNSEQRCALMQELEQKLEKYRHVVPLDADDLIKDMNEKITDFRDGNLILQRKCMIIQLVKKMGSLPPPLPSRENVFDILSIVPDALMQKVHPQQIQFCTFLIGHIYQNPPIFANCVRLFCKHATKQTIASIAGSVIPSIYGFYSSNEHISLVFPFFCSLVVTAPHDLVLSILLPFYCSSCTYRFIENVYARFGFKFCHDVRYDTDEQNESIVRRYGNLFQEAVAESFCLLSKSHQFLLRYMINEGWSRKDVMNFFLRDFVLQQLLRYVKNQPFKRHFNQLKYFTAFVHADADFCQPLYQVLANRRSIYEIPFAYEVFECQYVKLLMTPFDVDMTIKILMCNGALPDNVRPFLEPRAYLDVNYESFMFRVYSRKPPVCDPTDTWRPIVFSERIDSGEKVSDQGNERAWRLLLRKCEEDGCIDPIEHLKTSTITDVISPDKVQAFTNYAIHRYLDLLSNRALTFERFIVYKMYSRTLEQWNNLIRAHFDMINVPWALENTSSALHLINTKKLSTLHEALQIIKTYPRFELPYVTQHYLPVIVDKSLKQELDVINAAWTVLIMDARQSLSLPVEWKNSRMNRLVWDAIEHFKSMNFVEFRDMLQVMLESVELVEMVFDGHEQVIQFIIAFSDVQDFLSKFLLLDSLIMKQNSVVVFGNTDVNMARWSRLESSVLKLVSNDDRLVDRYVECEQKLMSIMSVNRKTSTPA